jgi:hypothetical protein
MFFFSIGTHCIHKFRTYDYVTPKFRIVSKTTAAEGFKTYDYVTPTFRIVSKTTAAEVFRTHDYEELDDTKGLIRIHISNIDNTRKQLIMFMTYLVQIKAF